MGFVFLLMLVVAVPLVPVLIAMVKVFKMRFGEARCQLISPDNVDSDTFDRLKPPIEQLLSCGFDYEGMRHEQRGERQTWQVVLSSAGGVVWALVEESEVGQLGRKVLLVTFGENDSSVVTQDGDTLFVDSIAQGGMENTHYVSALAQAEAHAARLVDEEVYGEAVGGDVFLKWLDRRANESIDTMYRAELLEEGGEGEFKFPLIKLPAAAFSYILYRLKLKKRNKEGESWLLSENLYASKTEPEESPAEEEIVESEELLEAAEELPLPLVDDALPNDAAVVPGVAALGAAAVAAVGVEGELPSGVMSEEGLPEEVVPEENLEPVAEESVPVEDSIPTEDSLDRDFALYEKQVAKRSWAYWLRGFGGRAFFFLSAALFVAWVSVSRGWSLQLLLYAIAALIVHEAGHAVVMLIRRSWDWSQFLVPVPHPMLAKTWPIKGGRAELFTILAGPMPGFIFGWSLLGYAFAGGQVNDSLLDVALVFALFNSITLLPLSPLDGGRILDLLLLRNAPGLRTVGLVVGGVLFLAIAAVGGGLLAAIIALLLFFGIPSSLRKSKLLPWFQANAKSGKEGEPLAGLSILRENGAAKVMKGKGGAARLDEFMGLGQGRSLGFLAGSLAVIVLLVSWVGPLVFPLYEVGKRALSWSEDKTQALALADAYWPAKEFDVIDSKAAEELFKIQYELDLKPAEKVFSNAATLDSLRYAVNRKAVAPWVAEEPVERQLVVRQAVDSLRKEALKAADEGRSSDSFRDLSYAFRILISWEPHYSLAEWVEWLELERSVLKELEDVSSRYSLPAQKIQWYEAAIAQLPKSEGGKLAALYLRDEPSLESVLQQSVIELKVSEVKREGGVRLPMGRAFLQALRSPASLLPLDNGKKRIAIASMMATASYGEKGFVPLGEELNASPDLRGALARIEANLSFREIARSALRIKRLGDEGMSPELTKLRTEYGFQSQVVTEGQRESLKLSRLNVSGERVEMEWLLKQ